MAVATFTPAEILQRIRYDPLTKKGSVIDVVQLVTGHDAKHASNALANILQSYPEVSQKSKLVFLKFPGRGQRPTPVADLPTLFRIMAILPGSRSRRFAGKSMDVFTRALAGDERLEPELKRRRTQLAATGLDSLAADVTTTVEDALAELSKPLELPVDQGVIYVVTSPLLHCIKLGFWTGSLDVLRSRYAMYYGPQLELRTWECAQCRAVERELLQEFAAHSVGGELLDKACLPDLVQMLDVALAM